MSPGRNGCPAASLLGHGRGEVRRDQPPGGDRGRAACDPSGRGRDLPGWPGPRARSEAGARGAGRRVESRGDRRRQPEDARRAAGRPASRPMGAGLGDRSPPPRRADPLHRAYGGPEPPLAGGCLLRAGGDRDGAGGPHLHGHVERGAHAPAPAAPSLHRRPDLRRARRARPRGATPHRATGARRPRPHLADRCPDTRAGHPPSPGPRAFSPRRSSSTTRAGS